MTNVAYTPLEKPQSLESFTPLPEFFPTWAEWFAVNKRTPVVKCTSGSAASGGTADIYTVSASQDLYISTIHLMGQPSDTAAADCLVSIDTTDSSIARIVNLRWGTGKTEESQIVALTFPMPIRIEAGTTIKVQVNFSTCFFSAGFTGWLVGI